MGEGRLLDFLSRTDGSENQVKEKLQYQAKSLHILQLKSSTKRLFLSIAGCPITPPELIAKKSRRQTFGSTVCTYCWSSGVTPTVFPHSYVRLQTW